MFKIVDKVTNVVMNYSEVETKVREATNDETWGPPGTLMGEISKYTFTYEHHPEVMSMLWKRMFESKRNWRRTYKSLLLLHYLINNGSERVVTNAREHIYDMKPLEEFVCRDENGKDQGINVRQKAKEIISFLQDDERLRESRKNARKTRDKFVGISSSEVQSQYSDRYAPEPRTRSTFSDNWKMSSSKYTDEDEDTSSKPYHDESPETENSKEEKKEKDESETITSYTSHDTSKKSPNPPKLVDLGAAATFGQETLTAPLTTTSNSPQQNLEELFGDFSSAPGDLFSVQPTTGSTNDGIPDFADFTGFNNPPPSGPVIPPVAIAPPPAPIIPVSSSQPFSIDMQFAAFSQPQHPQPLKDGLDPIPAPLLEPELIPVSSTETKKTEPSKSSLWNTPGVSIDLDNLMSITPKVTTSTNPTMNQMSTGSTSRSTGQTGHTSSIPTSYQSQPNYNVNMAALNTSMSGMSMGIGMGMRPPTGMSTGPYMGAPMGPNYSYGAGYGGYMMPTYGGYQQPIHNPQFMSGMGMQPRPS